MKGNSYSTEQKSVITDCFTSNPDRQLSVTDIEDWLHSRNIKIGNATIYRNLDKLEKEGTIRRFLDENGKQAFWQYTIDGNGCHDHYHLKCSRCGKVIHLQCHLTDTLDAHILEEHSFHIDRNRTVFYGLCNECDKEGEQK